MDGDRMASWWLNQPIWKILPSRELTYPLIRHIWRWFSFSPGGLVSWRVVKLDSSSGIDGNPTPLRTQFQKVPGLFRWKWKIRSFSKLHYRRVVHFQGYTATERRINMNICIYHILVHINHIFKTQTPNQIRLTSRRLSISNWVLKPRPGWVPWPVLEPRPDSETKTSDSQG